MSYLDRLNEEQRELLRKHVELVIEANKATNLTRIDSLDDALLLHVEDSLTALPEMEAAPEGRYADIGSGAGFPGIPLAVATGRSTLLVDARKKKMDIVSGIVSSLGIEGQVEVFAGRAELLARTQGSSFAVLTARALSKLSILMELASPLLKRGGQLICYKSHIDEAEMEDALRVRKMVGMNLKSDRAFTLEDYDRRIVVFEKVSAGQIKLPRLEGQAQKNPL